MTGRHRDVRCVVQEFGLGQACGHGQPLVAPVQHHGKVDVAPDHRADSVLGLQFPGTHAQFGVVPAQCEERPGEEPARRGRKGGESDLAHHLTALRLDVGLGQLDLGQDPGRVVGEQPRLSVSRTPRPFLARSCCPTSRSSFAICWETADVVTCSPSAAPLTEPCRASASRVRRRSRFNM